MNTSTNSDTNDTEMKKAGGAFADGLTLIRLLLTPIIMFIIIAKGWPDTSIAILASILFVIAALTDIFDDLTGGAETSRYRKFGWFDDIADMVLIIGTLAAIFYVIATQGMLHWSFMVPAAIIIGREILVGLVKGFELSRHGWPETSLGTIKTAIIMLAVSLLLAAPWLTPWFESLIANSDNVMDVYDRTSNQVWNTGLLFLWVGAALSLFTGFKLLTAKSAAANDG